MPRRLVYLIAAPLLALLGVLATASPTWAHARLDATSPANGAVLARPPARVTITFDERVFQITGAIQVYAPDGARVDTGPTRYGRLAPQITVALLPHLAKGTYTVAYHVVSDDSHPVQGTFTFSVGAPGSTVVNPATLGRSAGKLVDIAFGVVRWVAFCSFALLIGAVAFVIWCWPSGASRPAVLRLAMTAWSLLAASVLAAVLLQGVYGAAQGIGHLFWPNVLQATLHSRYGRAIGIRLLLVIAALFAFTITLGSLPAAGRRQRITAGAVWGLLTAALAATWAVADHAGTGAQVALAVPADTIHLSAMAIWLGGLAVLATIVLRHSHPATRPAARRAARLRGEPATAEAAQAVSRFSPLALTCVTVLVITGTYQAWRNVGSVGALAGTTYGRLLLAKIAGMCALIALGYLARRGIATGLRPSAAARVPAAEPVPAGRMRAASGVRPGRSEPGRSGRVGARPPEPDRPAVTLARLRWSVTAEVVIAAVVLAVTAVLVNTPTGRESAARPAAAPAWPAPVSPAQSYRSQPR